MPNSDTAKSEQLDSTDDHSRSEPALDGSLLQFELFLEENATPPSTSPDQT